MYADGDINLSVSRYIEYAFTNVSVVICRTEWEGQFWYHAEPLVDTCYFPVLFRALKQRPRLHPEFPRSSDVSPL
jgi:hypothetical protein